MLRGARLTKAGGLLCRLLLLGARDARPTGTRSAPTRLADAGRGAQILTRAGAGLDHPELAGVPETGHLKVWTFRMLLSSAAGAPGVRLPSQAGKKNAISAVLSWRGATPSLITTAATAAASAAAASLNALRVAPGQPAATPTPSPASAMAQGAQSRMFWFRCATT